MNSWCSALVLYHNCIIIFHSPTHSGSSILYIIWSVFELESISINSVWLNSKGKQTLNGLRKSIKSCRLHSQLAVEMWRERLVFQFPLPSNNLINVGGLVWIWQVISAVLCGKPEMSRRAENGLLSIAVIFVIILSNIWKEMHSYTSLSLDLYIFVLYLNLNNTKNECVSSISVYIFFIFFPDKNKHNSPWTDNVSIVFIIKRSRQQHLLNAFGYTAELRSLVESQDKAILHSHQSSVVVDKKKYTQYGL